MSGDNLKKIFNDYTPTIGLEIHAELKTATKMFCDCRNDPDEEQPNKNVCPICMGHPGTLPVLNKKAIEEVLKIGIAVDGELADFTEWDRKQYFYPDIPKGYQISQYAYPLVKGGKILGIELERIHLEEDTAQSTHDTHEKSLINFNRAGVPLMELVTKPVIHDAKTAVKFARELQLLIQYLGAGDANMEKGQMRVEANISVAKNSDDIPAKLGVKTEVKNLNSFRAVEKAIEYEIARQIGLLEDGKRVVQETRGWDDRKSETYSQRSKESAHDYRYFPEPDIPKLKISEVNEFKRDVLAKNMPELPWQRRNRFKNDYQATDKEAEMFVESDILASYMDEIVSEMRKSDGQSGDIGKEIRLVMNYLLTDYVGLLKKQSKNINEIKAISAKSWVELVSMLSKGEISSRGAKEIIGMLLNTPNESPKELAIENDLIQKNDVEAVRGAIKEVIDENSGVVSEYRGGKVASLQFLVGQAMKKTKGSANPTQIKEILIEMMK